MEKVFEKIIEHLKKDFSGSSDYLSGVNDGMYHLKRFLLNQRTPDGTGTLNMLLAWLSIPENQKKIAEDLNTAFKECESIRDMTKIKQETWNIKFDK